MHIETPLDQIDDAQFKALCEHVQRHLTESRVPGAAIGIYDRGVIRTNAFGIIHKDNPLPVTSDTIFQIASNTKTMTATLFMMLRDEGLVDLDTPVRAYLPDFKLLDEAVAQQVTPRHLLTHTVGWDGDLFEDYGDGADVLPKFVAAIAQRPQYFPLGQVWAYNNTGFAVAALIIEAVTQQRFEHVLQERLWQPLGMTMTHWRDVDIMPYRFATGHIISPEGLRLPQMWRNRRAPGAGSITSTVADMLAYGQFHLKGGLAPDGRRLLSEAAIAEMRTPQAKIGLTADFVGISWISHRHEGFTIYGHGGGSGAQLSAFLTIPERDFAFVALTNGAGVGISASDNARAFVEAHYFGIEKETHTLLATQPDMTPYAGTYSMLSMRVSVEATQSESLHLSFEARHAIVQAPPPATAQFVAADKIMVVGDEHPLQGVVLQFIRDAAGAIIALRIGGRAYARESATAT